MRFANARQSGRIIWTNWYGAEVIRLLEDPSLLQGEIKRRVDAAKKADPSQQRQQHLIREQTRLEKAVERLLTAYQESLLSLEELRQRIDPLRKQLNAVQSERQALDAATSDKQRYLKLVENLIQFQTRLRTRAETVDTMEKQNILRLLDKEILVGADSITIRHCLPMPPDPSSQNGPSAGNGGSRSSGEGSYLLRSGSHSNALRRPTNSCFSSSEIQRASMLTLFSKPIAATCIRID